MNRPPTHSSTDRLPMVKAFVPFAIGVVLAEYFLLPAWFVWMGFAAAALIALTARSSLYTLVSLLLFGWGIADLHRSAPDSLPRGVSTEFALTVEDAGSATLTAWRSIEHSQTSSHHLANGAEDDSAPTAEESAALSEELLWHACHTPIVLHTDSTLTLRTGERLVVRSYLNDLPHGSYGSLMQRRGYVGRMWLSDKLVISRDAPNGTTLHAAAIERLRRLALPAREQALCAAMSVGDRSGLTPEMRQSYARSGTSHLLSVSGLHVGIIFMLVNLILWWMPILRRGHLLRNLLAIALIWIYAVTAGFSPSVVRAAVMFSALQFSLASASTYVSGNTLAATAFVMLLFRPAALFDISFQLSFIAVAAILAWGIPLCRKLHTRHRVVNVLTDTLAIGLVAAVATTPLAAHTFGIASLIGIVVNPVVIPLATIAVLGSVVWILLPWTALAPLVRLIAGGAAAWQATITEWSAALPYGAFEWQPSAIATAAIYGIMVLITLLIQRQKPKKSVSLPR